MPAPVLREFPTFGRVATWEEWRTATAQTLPDYLFSWFVSNMVGFLLLWIAIKFPRFSRKVWGLLLILACLVNSYVALTDPAGFREFGVLAIPPMQHFIYSKLFASPALLVLPIAACQLWIGILLLLSEMSSLLKAALVGAILWFFGVATLGIGAGFPATLTFASTMMLCWPRPTTLPKHKTS